MPIDPQTQVLLGPLNDTAAKVVTCTPEEARALTNEGRITRRVDPSMLAQVGSIDDQVITVPHAKLAVRVYRPETTGPVPTVVYFHGGGFVIGNLDTHDDHARLICRDVEAVVVAVDYRLAPEHPFPAPFDDALAATQWVAANIADLGNDPDRLGVAGDSAGAALAAAVAVATRSDGPRLAAQMVLYASTDLTDNPAYPSRIDNADGYYLTGDLVDWCMSHYISEKDIRDPRASVIFAEDFAGVAPAVIGVGEYDLLRDEDIAYAKVLSESGVPVALHVLPGLIHGFYAMGLVSSAAAEAVSTLNADFRRLINGGSGERAAST